MLHEFKVNEFLFKFPGGCFYSHQLHEALQPADGLRQAGELVVAGVQDPQR